MIVFGDDEWFAGNSHHRQSRQCTTVGYSGHRDILNHPVLGIPRPMRKMRVLPVGVCIYDIHMGLDGPGAVTVSCSDHEASCPEFVPYEIHHAGPVTLFGLVKELVPVPLCCWGVGWEILFFENIDCARLFAGVKSLDCSLS